MNREELREAVWEKMKEENIQDARRFKHTEAVVGFSRKIADTESLSEFEEDCLILAAILHDIGIHECERLYGSTAGNLQEIVGAHVAGEILEEAGAPEDVRDRVCYLVSKHHTTKDVEGLDWQILLEADFIRNCIEEDKKLTKEQIKTYRDKVYKTNEGIRLLNQAMDL